LGIHRRKKKTQMGAGGGEKIQRIVPEKALSKRDGIRFATGAWEAGGAKVDQ